MRWLLRLGRSGAAWASLPWAPAPTLARVALIEARRVWTPDSLWSGPWATNLPGSLLDTHLHCLPRPAISLPRPPAHHPRSPAPLPPPHLTPPHTRPTRPLPPARGTSSTALLVSYAAAPPPADEVVLRAGRVGGGRAGGQGGEGGGERRRGGLRRVHTCAVFFRFVRFALGARDSTRFFHFCLPPFRGEPGATPVALPRVMLLSQGEPLHMQPGMQPIHHMPGVMLPSHRWSHRTRFLA